MTQDRIANWGESEAAARYQTGDDDPDGGDFIVVRDLDGNVTLLQYDFAASTFVFGSDVDLDSNALADVGSLNMADFVGADSGTVPVSQGDGTLAMETVDTETEIDLISVADADGLPDPENLTKPTIAYVESQDDYAGVFQA